MSFQSSDALLSTNPHWDSLSGGSTSSNEVWSMREVMADLLATLGFEAALAPAEPASRRAVFPLSHLHPGPANNHVAGSPLSYL